MSEFTTFYGFELPNFRDATWHDAWYANFRAMDTLIKLGTGLPTVKGAWANATAYVADDRVLDPQDGTLWLAKVNHTSAITGLFSADRAANPTYWQSVGNGWTARGAWTQDTIYLVGDTAYDASEYLYAVAIADHTSDVAGTLRDDIANWVILMDGKAAVTAAVAAQVAAEAARNAAQTAETNAETAETNAASSAATATTQATNASNSAAAASTSEGNAAASESAAAASATDADASADAAAISETNAALSAAAAATFDPDNFVDFTQVQSKTDVEQHQARTNIGLELGFPMFHAIYELPTATAGGGMPTGVTTRAFNTVLIDEIGITLTGLSTFLFPAGTYIIDASAPVFTPNQSRIFLYNYVTTGILLKGVSSYFAANSVGQVEMFGKVAFADPIEVDVRTFSAVSRGTDGFGVAVGDGQSEIYNVFKAWKVQ